MGPVPQPEEDRDHPSRNEQDIEDADHPDVMINVDISDSDDDDDDGDDDDGYGGYMGYQALAQDGGPAGLDTDSESEHEEQTEQDVHVPDNGSTVVENVDVDMECHVPEGLVHQVRHPDYPNTANLPGYMQVPELPRPDRKDILWNQERQSDNLKQTEDTDKIMSVMSNIKLPSTNIPDWAKTLSDDQWQLQVVNKLKHRTSQRNNSEVNKGTSQIQDINNVTGTKTESESKQDNSV